MTAQIGLHSLQKIGVQSNTARDKITQNNPAEMSGFLLPIIITTNLNDKYI